MKGNDLFRRQQSGRETVICSVTTPLIYGKRVRFLRYSAGSVYEQGRQ